MMFDEINRDMLKIVYRYKWQLLINKVIEDYHNSLERYNYGKYEWVATKNTYINKNLLDKLQIARRLRAHFNYRRFEERINWKICNFKTISLTYKVYFRYIVALKLPMNYVYTSTKYLTEIRERGIVCLSINSDV